MTDLDENNDGTYTVKRDSTITYAIREAIDIAKREKKLTTFRFLDIVITVAHDSNLEIIRREFYRAINGYISKEIGPYPKAELSPEDLANDAKIEAEKEQKRQERRKLMAKASKPQGGMKC